MILFFQKLRIIVVVFSLCVTSSAQSSSEISTILFKIENQINEFENIFTNSNREKISVFYYSKLNESKATLSQIKAKATNNSYDKQKVNTLFLSINKILNHKNNNSNDYILVDKSLKGLTNNGIIRGTIKDFNTGLSIANSYVFIYDSSGELVGNLTTDNLGRFIFNSLPSGQYALIASKPSLGYIKTAQPNIPCSGGLGNGCQIEDLNLINLDDSEILEGVDIELKIAPIFSGVVSDSQDPSIKIGTAKIELFNDNGDYISEVFSESYGSDKGKYEISAPDEGSYYITVKHSEYQTQLFDGINCDGLCGFNLGSLVQVSAGQQIDNFNFELDRSSGISGILIDSITNLPASNGKIAFLNLDGETVASTNVDANGSWIEEYLPIGDYNLISYRSEGYLATVYDQLSCKNYYGFCSDVLASGQLVSHSDSITEDLTVKQIKGGSIKGRVTDESGSPISGARIYLFDTNLERISDFRSLTDSNGYYETYAISNGSYYLIAHADNSQGELYPNINCHFWECDYNNGSLVTISNLSNVENISFQLNDYALISGKVTHNNTPVAYKEVIIRGLSNSYTTSAYTNSQGDVRPT